MPNALPAINATRDALQRYRRAGGQVNETDLVPPSLGALVVLGCRTGPDGRPSPALSRRIQGAVDAFSAGLAPVIVASGGARWAGLCEADVMRRELVAAGVPNAAVLVERASRSTLENAQQSARLLAERGIRSVGVVTCDWHMPRALALFARCGLDALPVPCASPPVGTLRRTARAAREAMATQLSLLLARLSG